MHGPADLPTGTGSLHVVDLRARALVPVFVLTSARSGSTLLRFLLDTHPDLSCPPESDVAGACAKLARVWRTLEGTDRRDSAPGPAALSGGAAAAVRTAVEAPVEAHLHECGKARWCDKSLDNVLHADLLAQLWPAAQFICLVRHSMDTIASGVEAAPWGLNGFGYTPFVVANPGNSVAALADYWTDRTERTLGFAERYADRCHLIRYEDLVDDPDGVMAAAFDFLGVRPIDDLASKCFDVPHDAGGSGDEKIWLTSAVERSSVGRGVVVPANAIPPRLRDRMNETLDELGYRKVGHDWGNDVVPVDPRRVDTGRGNTSSASAPHDDDAASRVAEHLLALPGARLAAAAERWPHLRGTTLGLAVYAVAGTMREVHWQIGATAVTEDASHAADVTIAGDAIAWAAVIDGRANLAVECGSRRLRVLGPRARALLPEELHALGFVFAPDQAADGSGARPVLLGSS